MNDLKEKRLRLWKARMTDNGHDVSKINTLEEAEKFVEDMNKPKTKQPKTEKKQSKKEKNNE